MNPEIDSALRQMRTSLQKMDESLSIFLQNQAIKAWSNIDIAENRNLIYFFGVRSNSAVQAMAGGENLQGLIDAQIGFRLHPARKTKEDVYQTISDLRLAINAVSDTLASGADLEDIPTELTKTTAEIQNRVNFFTQSGKLLQSVYMNFRRIALPDMVDYIRIHDKTGNDMDRRLLKSGLALFALLEGNAPPSSAAAEQQLLPLGQCRAKAEELMAHLMRYNATTGEVAERTSRLVPVVIADNFVAPVMALLHGITGLLQGQEGAMEKLATPVKEEFAKLNRSGNLASFNDYTKEIEAVAQRVKIALTDLGRQENFLTIIETCNSVLSIAMSYSSWLRELPDKVAEEINRPGSPLNLAHFATVIKKRYYSVGLFALLKRFFNRPLSYDLVYKTLKTCPVLPAGGNKGNV
ncbi:MAG: hypothetical protein OEV91_04420, partial [Desulfobulbaceae bacterium]|nr:hypothetical protein [Desulfobulbaceae bacterium]